MATPSLMSVPESSSDAVRETPIQLHPSGWTYLWWKSEHIVTEYFDPNPLVLELVKASKNLLSGSSLGDWKSRDHIELYFRDCHDPLPLVIIDHERQVAIDLADVPESSQSLPAPSHMQHRDYWRFMEEHPAHHTAERLGKIIKDGVQEALEYLEWCYQAAIFPSDAPRSTISLTRSKEVAQFLTQVYDRYKPSEQSPGTPESAGREMSSFSHAVLVSAIAGVLVNKYDFYNSKYFWMQGRDEFFQDPASEYQNTALKVFVNGYFSACSIILLFTPRRYLSVIMEIRKLFLTGDEWRRHLQRLINDWKSFNLLATVMLAASVSFLSAQDIGSVTATAAVASALFALGSVLSGLYCLAYYRAYGPTSTDRIEDATIGDQYANNIFGHGKNRPKYVAVILSLPEASLLWSIIAFGVAALAYNLEGGRFTAGVILVLSVFGIVTLAAAFVFAMMWYVWGKGSVASRIYRRFSMPTSTVASRMRHEA